MTTTFSQSPTKRADELPGPSLWHVFLGLQFKDGTMLEAEHVVETRTCAGAVSRAIAEAEGTLTEELEQIYEVRAKKLPEVIR